jgi:hypothetical protein
MVTRTAHHTTENAIYKIDYSTTNDRLDRIGLDIFRPPQEEQEESFVGTVHYDGHNISCHLGMEEDLVNMLETAVGFIAQIIEEVGNEPAEAMPNNHTQR